MINYLKNSEGLIMELINSGLGEKYSLAYKIEDIEELPVKEFSTIQKLLSSGEAIVRKSPSSIDSTTFEIISTPTEKRLIKLYMSITYFGPIIGIILSFVHSWYWLSLIVIAPIVGMSLSKKTYLHALFNRAYNSEIIFSYLFTAGKVTIELPDHDILYRNP